MNKYSFVCLFALLHARSSDAGGHAGQESCACVAEEQGFSIDCDDTNAMLASLTELKTRSCAADCSSAECVKHYFVVQSHHDHCPEQNLPEAIEDGFHDYDESCVHCEIHRHFTEGAPPCPVAVCNDGSGYEAFVSLLDEGCASDCSSDACRDLFFALRSVHDGCPHDVLPHAAEEGLHDLEVPCVRHVCNSVEDLADPTVCHDHEHDHEDGTGSHGHEHDHDDNLDNHDHEHEDDHEHDRDDHDHAHDHEDGMGSHGHEHDHDDDLDNHDHDHDDGHDHAHDDDKSHEHEHDHEDGTGSHGHEHDHDDNLDNHDHEHEEDIDAMGAISSVTTTTSTGAAAFLGSVLMMIQILFLSSWIG